MGQSRPRESRRRRRRRAGGAGMKSGKGRGEARTSFQGKVRAFSLADRLGERGKRLQQRLRLLALGARHLADSAAPRGVPLRPGVAPASDGGAETHGANTAVASDRPPRIFPLGGFQAKDPRESSERGPKPLRGARRHGLVHRGPRAEAGARRALPTRGARDVPTPPPAAVARPGRPHPSSAPFACPDTILGTSRARFAARVFARRDPHTGVQPRFRVRARARRVSAQTPTRAVPPRRPPRLGPRRGGILRLVPRQPGSPIGVSRR